VAAAGRTGALGLHALERFLVMAGVDAVSLDIPGKKKKTPAASLRALMSYVLKSAVTAAARDIRDLQASACYYCLFKRACMSYVLKCALTKQRRACMHSRLRRLLLPV
jgi:hypothetical protein